MSSECRAIDQLLDLADVRHGLEFLLAACCRILARITRSIGVLEAKESDIRILIARLFGDPTSVSLDGSF